MIMRCREDQEGKVVYPIFYNVDPSEVRKQSGSFGEAFQKHERDEDPNEVEQWRKDLKASADLVGRNLETTADRREGEFVRKVVGDINGLLKTSDLKEAKHSVGIAFRVEEFGTKYLDVGGSHGVQIIGIWGMGGIGKTTLARAIYSTYHHIFRGQCYLEEVRSKKKNMVSLQEQLLRDILKRPDIKISSVAEGTKEIEKRLGSMKVLIVVDDIDDVDQFDELAIEHDSFGPGSRIILITRDEQVLNIQKVDKKYKAQTMTDEEALELLSWHAFGNHCPDKEYIELATDVVDYCGGLLLALKVVGHLLAAKKSKSIWKSTLDKLRNLPHGKIHETLRLSYDGLSDDHVKGVFLDISHFFINWDGTKVVAILDSCSRFCVESEIKTIQDQCLLDYDFGFYRMHDLIRDMGREIVRVECATEPGKRSRLWHHEDVTSVLRDESGTEAIRGLTLELAENSDEHPFRTKAFKKMRNLKFLRLKNVKLTGSYRHLSKELRSLCWHGFPLEVIPEDFDLGNLVLIDLSNSKLVRVWEDSDLLPKKLKFLYLDHSHNLTQLPDFSKLPHLEDLSLSGCKSVSGGYHLFAQLKMLQYLDLKDCNITDDAILESLRSLSSLRSLTLDGNGFNRLPILSGLSQLTFLYLNHCTSLQAIPDLPTSLQLKDCRNLKDIPNLDNFVCYMDTLHMEGCTSLSATFKENILLKWNGDVVGGLSLCK
ncbi:disease resistance protein RPV1-like isoform X2 [Malus domestica]|uniref:disease resistance protein RPV1-like isoform X2 n=1 Tax=Malus domestica TaxID=3750 RepID=UPI000498E615